MSSAAAAHCLVCISMQERTRAVTYPQELLVAAKRDPGLITQLERSFAAFLADSEWRTTLPAMPRAQRGTAHALAEQWGFTSTSTKPEHGRCVEIFKNAKSARPSRYHPSNDPSIVIVMVILEERGQYIATVLSVNSPNLQRLPIC